MSTNFWTPQGSRQDFRDIPCSLRNIRKANYRGRGQNPFAGNASPRNKMSIPTTLTHAIQMHDVSLLRSQLASFKACWNSVYGAPCWLRLLTLSLRTCKTKHIDQGRYAQPKTKETAFTRTFRQKVRAFFSETLARNPTGIGNCSEKKNLFRWTFLFWVDFFGWIFLLCFEKRHTHTHTCAYAEVAPSPKPSLHADLPPPPALPPLLLA